MNNIFMFYLLVSVVIFKIESFLIFGEFPTEFNTCALFFYSSSEVFDFYVVLYSGRFQRMR